MQKFCSSTDWGAENFSYQSSTSDGSEDSYSANWENYISSNGYVFYAEYTSRSEISNVKIESKRASSTRSSRNSKKLAASKNLNKNVQKPTSTSQVQIQFLINPENGLKFGRGATACESLLGFSTCPFSDGNRLLVNQFMMNSLLNHDKIVKIGDWFKSINDIEVNVLNIDEILKEFKKPTTINLKFDKIPTDKQQSTSTVLQKITNFENFSNLAPYLFKKTSPVQQSLLLPTMNETKELMFSVIILPITIANDDENNTNATTTTNQEHAFFCYPEAEFNKFYSVRGSFLTLHSILKNELKTIPIHSKIDIDGNDYTVSYLCQKNSLLLISISSNYIRNSKHAQIYSEEIAEFFQFHYDKFDSTNLMLNMKRHLYQSCKIIETRLKNKHKNPIYFLEENIQKCHHITLPKEIQLRIYDALNELEAMDYRDWNDEPLNSHREFFIVGSALYFQASLLINQLPLAQRMQVESVLRCSGIFDFIQNQNVNDFVYWKEILIEKKKSRYFLAICSRNELTLACVLQAFNSERQINDKGIFEDKVIGPSLFYIEEIQDTLDHLTQCGIEALAELWATVNKRPKVLNENILVETNDLINFSSSSTTKKTDSASLNIRNPSENKRNSAETSITHSEDSNKDDDSDSDWDGFPNSHKSSTSGFDPSELKASLLKELTEILPVSVTAGKTNNLIHYVDVDYGTGIILSQLYKSTDVLIEQFKSACHLIHVILQKTKKSYQNMLQKTMDPNKNQHNIKEHGILITVLDSDGNNVKFWVIGRLFISSSRELYVCHKSDVMQNLVEMAFRLSFLTAG